MTLYAIKNSHEFKAIIVFKIAENESPISHIKKYEIIKGDATKTVEKYLEEHPETISSFANFDFDVYNPTRKCLEAIKSHVTKGTIIAFDELNHSVWKGETIAFKEVFGLDKKKNPDVYCDVVLNTDSNELIKMFKEQLNFQVDIIERNPSLGLDNTPKVEVIFNCLDVMKKRKSINYDMVVDLDITSPLRTVEDVDNLIRKKTESNSDIVFSVTDSRRNPYFNMVKKTENGYERVIASKFNVRQEAPEIFDMNASLYAYSPEFLESGKGIFEGRCDFIKMLDTEVLDLDQENDFEFMQIIAEYLFNKYPDFKEIRDNIIDILV